MAKNQFQFFSSAKSLRCANKKIAIHSLSPKAAALILTYDKFAKVARTDI